MQMKIKLIYSIDIVLLIYTWRIIKKKSTNNIQNYKSSTSFQLRKLV